MLSWLSLLQIIPGVLLSEVGWCEGVLCAGGRAYSLPLASFSERCVCDRSFRGNSLAGLRR